VQGDVSVAGATKRVKRELLMLPQNELITRDYCTRFAGVLNLDGVYIKIKGYPKAVPFIYGIDFETHDIPVGLLALAESENAFEKILEMLKEAEYPLYLVIADEAPALKPALARVFPSIEIQLCHVHILRNIKALLHLSLRDRTHEQFFRVIQRLLVLPGKGARLGAYRSIERQYGKLDLYSEILFSLWERWDDLFRFEDIRKQGLRVPRTNNLIEGYNAHFKARVDSIKGFESFSSASRFLNGWVLKRRFKIFRDCGKPFEHLNGHSSFEKSRNPQLPWPEIFGISPPDDI
jgi:transposase-like protein